MALNFLKDPCVSNLENCTSAVCGQLSFWPVINQSTLVKSRWLNERNFYVCAQDREVKQRLCDSVLTVAQMLAVVL